MLKTDTDPLFEAYITSIPKFIADSHAAAQENALEVLSVYIHSRPDLLVSHSENITKNLIEKGLGSTKQSTKQKSLKMLLDFYTIHKNPDSFIQGIIAALSNKNIKIQAAAISSVNALMSSFGAKAFSFKPFLGIIEKFASVSNPQVRSEALSFYKETYRWVRDLIKPSIEKLKKAQKDELEKSFEDIIEIAIPTRYIVGQEPEASEALPNCLPKAAAIDIYEMADARDVFNKYSERWTETVLAMEKWVDKKSALEELNNELNYPKIAEKSPLALTSMAKRLFNDSNVNVMLQAVKMIGLLAKGQRKYFDSLARQFFSLIVTKFKDKKPQVIQEAHTALDNLLYSITIEQIMDDIKEALDDKTPSVKINMTIWLEKNFVSTPDDALARILRSIGNLFKKNTDDSVSEVRNISFKIISYLLRRVPDVINPLIKDLPAAKLKKIEEAGDGNKAMDIEEEKQSVKVLKKTPTVKEGPKGKNKAQKGPENKNPTAEEESSSAITPEEAEAVVSPLIPADIFVKLKDNA